MIEQLILKIVNSVLIINKNYICYFICKVVNYGIIGLNVIT